MSSTPGIDVGEFGQRARHVIGAGDDDQRFVAVIRRPVARLGGVADGVAGGVTEVDAAREHGRIRSGIERIGQALRCRPPG